MYLTFFGLREKPFNVTPDPKFLFLTPGHREALAQLVYGVTERKGFIVLTGETGTGKTTLLRALLQRLDSTTAVAFVSNTTLDFDGILEYMLEDFGIAKAGQSPAQRIVGLNNFLIERQRAGQNSVLILDEAQNLDPRTLERVRLLSNFETVSDKLLQILLVGQPELRDKLQLPELRQLKQRIGLRSVIPRLTEPEVGHYIRTRLRIAGASDRALFSDRAVNRIAGYTAGIPRLINVVCDHCLLIGYAERKRRIDRDVVDQSVKYLEDGMPTRPRRQRRTRTAPMTVPRWALAGGAAAILAGSVVAGWRSDALRYVSGDVAAYVVHLWYAVRTLVTG
ncbi:MAG: ExeA family protein [Candidatus Rokuibacteriota bacterium]